MTRQSPTKRASSMIPALTTKGARSSVPSSPSRSSRMTAMAASTSKASSLAASKNASVNSFATTNGDSSFVESGSDTENEQEKPRRKAGFGTPRRPTTTSGPPRRQRSQDEDEDGKRENVVVCVRVRPSRQGAADQIYSFSPQTGALALAPSHPVVSKRGTGSVSLEYEFAFDALILHPSTTEALYEDKIKSVVVASTNGFNGTVFAYGQTSSGKTHTMLGTPDEPGVIPLAIREVFDAICSEPNRSFSLRVSLLEIYNETINDLLSASNASTGRKALDVASNGSVKGLTERAVSTPEQVMATVEEGMENRRVGSTDWNERSSRGHCLFSLTIESLHKTTGEARTSKLHLIDLAGSESATAQEERRKEGAFINRSLLTLGTVISKLAERTNSHIPYRDSKLTRLLQPALSGNSRVAIIVAISPDLPQATETLSSLRFARRAKMIETKAERGVMVSDQILLKQYADQVERLKAQILEREESDGDSRDVRSKMDELMNANQQAQDELARKELELTALKTQLEQVNSLILTGNSMEANNRRTSSSFASLMSPRSGKRTVSAMSGIGLGTPSSRSIAQLDRADSAVGEIKRDMEHEREVANLKEQLEQATASIESLKSQLEALRLTSSNVMSSERTRHAAETERLQQDVFDLAETSRAHKHELQKALATLEASRIELSASAQKAARLDAVTDDLDTARRELADHVSLSAALKEQLQASEQRAMQAEQRAAASDERLASDTRDETISSLQREVALAKKELQTVITTKADALASVKEQLASVETERDVAQRMLDEANAKGKALADIEELNAKERELHLHQLRSESQAAVSQAQAEVKRVQAELALKNDRIEQLERTIERFKALEGQRSSSLAIQKSSTNALRSRIADLQARSNSSASLVSSQRSSSGGDATTVVELQVRNGELVSRVADLEKMLSEARRLNDGGDSADNADKEQMTACIEEQSRLRQEAQASADEWKAKFAALSTSLQAAAKLSPPANVVESPFSRSPSQMTDENSPPRRTPLSRAGSTSAYQGTGSPAGTLNGSHRKAASVSTMPFDRPPPLPYSPHQRDNKERKARRETIARDLAMLREKSAVERTKSVLDSPGAASSPRRADDDWIGSGSRGKKSSTDSARMWT